MVAFIIDSGNTFIADSGRFRFCGCVPIRYFVWEVFGAVAQIG